MNKIFLLLLLLALPFCFLRSQRALVVAHRGGAGEGVENTLSCIAQSVALGVDAVEVDVRLTLDGQVVVCHDATIARTTNGSGAIKDMLLREIQTFNVASVGGVVSDETIPTLKQVLQLVQGRCVVLVDVKKGGRGIEKQIIADVLDCDAAHWVAVQSFSDAVLRRFAELAAPFPLEKLVVFKIPLLPIIFDGSLRYFSFRKYAHISSFNFHKDYLPPSFVAKIRRRGKGVKVWTLTSPRSQPSVEVDAVITDYPSLWPLKQ